MQSQSKRLDYRLGSSSVSGVLVRGRVGAEVDVILLTLYKRVEGYSQVATSLSRVIDTEAAEARVQFVDESDVTKDALTIEDEDIERVTIDGLPSLLIALPAAKTQAAGAGQWRWDVRLVYAGKVYYPVSGRLILESGITSAPA